MPAKFLVGIVVVFLVLMVCNKTAQGFRARKGNSESSSNGCESGKCGGLNMIFKFNPLHKLKRGIKAQTSPETNSAEETDQDNSKRCDFGWMNFGTKCLKLHNTPQTFSQAYNTCRDDAQGNGTLLTLQTLEEQDNAEKLFVDILGGKTGSLRFIWIGAVRSPHTGFYWIGANATQVPMTYTNWKVNEPDSMNGRGSEACTVFQLSSEMVYGEWHDIGCDYMPAAFVCEKYL